jgi:hypothetical protein
MVRIIVQTSDAGMAANVGGNVETDVKSFDIEAPALEAYLRQYARSKVRGEATYWHRSVIGAEVLPPEAP